MSQTKQKRAFFALRAIVAFLLLAALIVGLYLVAYRAYPKVATWGASGDHSTLIYEGETYARVGKIMVKVSNDGEYTFNQGKDKCKIEEQIGVVEDDGLPMMTEEVTLDPDAETESGETAAGPRPNGDPSLSRDHAYILYSVKDMEDTLILLEADGEFYLYRIAEEETTGAEADK